MKNVTTKAKAFNGKLENIKATVDADGTVRVWDELAAHYTTCHGLSAAAQQRIRRLAA